MADHISITTPLQGSPSRISWGSVIAGVVVATAVMFTLCVLSMAFGFGLLKPLDPSKDAMIPAMAMGGVIAWTASALIATFTGALAAAHLARQRNETDSVLHGLLVWGIGIVAMITLGATAAGVLVGGAFSLVGSGMHAAGSALGGAAHGAGAALGGTMSAAGSALGTATQGATVPGFDWDAIKFKAESLLKQGTGTADTAVPGAGKPTPDAGAAANQHPAFEPTAAASGANGNDQGGKADNGKEPAQATVQSNPTPAKDGNATGAEVRSSRLGTESGRQTNDEAMVLIGRVFGSPTGTINEADRAALVSMLTARTSLNQEEATQMVQQWEKTAQKAREQYQALKVEVEEKARAAAAAAAKALADAAWIAFVATILAASAAMLGAHLGGPRLSAQERRSAMVPVGVVQPT